MNTPFNPLSRLSAQDCLFCSYAAILNNISILHSVYTILSVLEHIKHLKNATWQAWKLIERQFSCFWEINAVYVCVWACAIGFVVPPSSATGSEVWQMSPRGVNRLHVKTNCLQTCFHILPRVNIVAYTNTHIYMYSTHIQYTHKHTQNHRILTPKHTDHKANPISDFWSSIGAWWPMEKGKLRECTC